MAKRRKREEGEYAYTALIIYLIIFFAGHSLYLQLFEYNTFC